MSNAPSPNSWSIAVQIFLGVLAIIITISLICGFNTLCAALGSNGGEVWGRVASYAIFASASVIVLFVLAKACGSQD